ncbi:hypothetical protein T4A_619 [Trichinella pseudospiralis]|uniref:Uncharacterized protein n=1 Tax=Trichinella pseudospiralis TaxID=6337 RepID=A0A0V1DTA3_TRIPS|nr:hypothetical protein T4A_619 [Trichinella pseudospiralis]
MTVDHVVASPTFSSRSHPAVASLITSNRQSDALHTWWHSRRGDREVGILQPSEYDQRVLLGSVETKRRSRLAMSATGKAESLAQLASNNQHPTRASHFEISYRRSRMPSNADTREKAKKRQRMKGYRCMKVTPTGNMQMFINPKPQAFALRLCLKANKNLHISSGYAPGNMLHTICPQGVASGQYSNFW